MFWLMLQDVIRHLRINCYSFICAASMSPIVAGQVLSSMKIIMGKDGTNEGKDIFVVGLGLIFFLLYSL